MTTPAPAPAVGGATPDSAAPAAGAALALVGSDPAAALAAATAAVRLARREGDRAAEATAHRASALALRERGELVPAEARARTAVRVALRGGAVLAEAEARMSLAFVLLERGKGRAALGQADRAATSLDGLPSARLQSQRALVLQRLGRLDEALAAFGAAVPVLRRLGDDLWEARALNNRGLLHAYRGALGPAQSDLARSRELHLAAGREVFAADADLNLGFVAGRAGDLASALMLLDRAEASYARHGAVHPQLLLDRGEVLLSAGMVGDARAVIERALAGFDEAGAGADRAEALLLLAQAALADGVPAEALDAARTARLAFAAQGRPGWARLSDLVALRALDEGGAPPGSLEREALTCADEMASAGWRSSELEARLTAAAAAGRAGHHDVARQQLERASAARRSASLELRSRAWYAEAQLRLQDGDRPGARRAVRAGLTAVRRRQAAVGATDLRAHTASHGARLAGLGLSMALEEGAAAGVLAWAERWRAGSLRLRPVRPPDEPAFAAALAEMRRRSTELTVAQLAGAASAGPLRAARVAERRVIALSRASASPLYRPPPPRGGAAAVAEALGERVLVEFVANAGTLYAVTLGGGRTRLTVLGEEPGVAALVESAHFVLRRAAAGFGQPNGVASTVAERLDEVLLGPLRPQVEDRPVILVPTGVLHPLPWGLLPGLEDRPFVVAPSAASWLSASGSGCETRHGAAVFASGPGLPAAVDEVRDLASRHTGSVLLSGTDATAAAVLSAMDGAELAHVAAHGRLRTDNPLFSALELADGPLTVYDLERLARAPRVVVLPACQSGLSAVRAGDEVMGLVSALLALGAGDVVAPVVPVGDKAASVVMAALHAGLRQGQSPPVALAATRIALAQEDPTVRAAAAGFSCYGA